MRTTRIVMASIISGVLGLTACAPQDQGSSEESASSFPDKPIELVIPWDPGGATDLAGRVLSEALSDELGVPVNVLNKPGAEQISGVDYVRRAKNDGYTLLVDGASSSSIQSFSENLPFDWDDRTFIARAASGAHAIAVPKDSPYKTLEDLVTALEEGGKQFRHNWSGGTSTTDLTTLSLFEQAGTSLSDNRGVAFESSGETMEALAGGDLDFGTGGASATFSMASGGNIRVLAHTGSEAIPQLPDVPTTADAGYPELDVTYWVGISGPPDMPESIQESIQDALSKALEDPAVQEKLTNIAVTADPLMGQEFDGYVHEEVETYTALRDLIDTGN
jgi:tripartite-type tricarboxylate transporter receptor subunit TctC